MATVKRIDRTAERAASKIWQDYWRFVRTILSGEELDADLVHRLVTQTAKSLLFVDLLGREFVTRLAMRELKVNYQFDAPESIDFPEREMFARTPGLDSILASPLVYVAKSFADLVPNLGERIVSISRASGSAARILWAEESRRILELLSPVLQKQIEETGVSAQEFFAQSEAKLARTEFADVARARLDNIFRTNLSTAVNKAVYQEKNTETLVRVTPFYEYNAVDDRRVRPQHAAFDGFVAPVDWPGWQAIWPPNGYQCRCAPPASIFEPQARRRGFLKQDGTPNEVRYQSTWATALRAGLITAAGALTYPLKVTMIDATGDRVTDSMPQQGFAGIL